MKIAIAVETKKDSLNYDIWFLEYSANKEIKKVGIISKQKLIEELFRDVENGTKGTWKAFTKEKDYPTDIEIFDFISMNPRENTHFGNLPTINEFKPVIEELNTIVYYKKAS